MDIAVYLHALTGLFVIIDPVGAALIFNSLTANSDKKYRTNMAVKAALISASTLILFGNYGEALLFELGININSLRISGGLLLFYTAFNMITKAVELKAPKKQTDISVFPMSVPLLAGPGTLTLCILLFSHAPDAATNISVSLAIVTILSLTFAMMLAATYLQNMIGKTGNEILRRFLGVILAALAIQFIYDGIVNISL